MTRNSPIHVFKAVLNKDDIYKELESTIDSGWVGLGPKTKQFEGSLSSYISENKKIHFSALNSCTSALHLAIKASLKDKSNVLTTPITFISSNHAILYENHTPIFCDVDKLTGNIDPNFVEYAITKYNIGAILVVHVGGYACPMDEINYLANKYGVKVIEDCAHSFGGKYKGVKIGNSNNICCWSFQAVKNLPVGDGGAISSINEEDLKWFNKMRWLGINKDTVSRSFINPSKQTYSWDYDVEDVGYKYHMSDITASIGLTQLRNIDDNNNRRKFIANFYRDNIKTSMFPDYKNDRESSYHFYPIFFDNRDEICKKLIDNNIYPGVHYKRNDLYSNYNNFIKINNLENAEWYQTHELTLPIHLGLSDADLQYIVDVVNN